MDDGWTCHICKRMRPDARISVSRNVRHDPILGTFRENVRYCNDEPDCQAKAATFTFLGQPVAEEPRP